MNISISSLLLVFYFFFNSYAYAQSSEAKQQGIAVDVITQSDISWDGSPLPSYPTGQPEVTILKITIQPGVSLPIHEHPYINAGILTKGQLTVVREDNGKTLHLKAGDSITELVNIWHYGKNEGKTPAEIIVFYAGVKGKPVTILEKNQKHTSP
ncbi:cupin domain-containing protein [uncultured Shewanella sp.]|uniref:cupin domain-containing protein n=1 Tax=uncultured Shewanella sp. TaxID=173975 RepID=UPI00261ABCBA|nr:cupin domain-containing protein [uncultured Shewanella sp.]